MAAGYSGKSLTQKLGIRPGSRIAILGPPPRYRSLLTPLPPDVTIVHTLGTTPLPFIHFFSRTVRELTATFPRLRRAMTDDGMIWISWPKLSSGVRSDLNENIVRELGLAHRLVDVKVCAVDDTWSGLKFMIRRGDRR